MNNISESLFFRFNLFIYQSDFGLLNKNYLTKLLNFFESREGYIDERAEKFDQKAGGNQAAIL